VAAPPDPPELPPGARPRWPAWSGFAAMGAGTVAVLVASGPLLPVAFSSIADGALGALALLVLILVQDIAYVGAAVGFAWLRGRPRAWQFGLRSTPPLRTALVAIAAAAAVLGFEIGFVELTGIEEGDTDELGTGQGLVPALAFSLAAIVVAPVAEELFFRGFLYRSLRNRLPVWGASAINALVFSLVHVQYFATPGVLVVIAAFAVGACLAYEATGSIFVPIVMHAAFNTLATAGTDAGYVAPIAVGTAVAVACVLVPLRVGRGPSPFPPAASA
jgi:membrane protease YdiL (CAAX protease family)